MPPMNLHNLEGQYSQSQMIILLDVPSNDLLQANRKFDILATPPGVHDIEVDVLLSKEDNLAKGFSTVKVGLAPSRTQNISNYLQAQKSNMH